MVHHRIIASIIFLFSLISIVANDFIFTPIDVSHGLSDNQIRYILQLPDGRMVITTNGNVNIYDGNRFKYVHRNPLNMYPLAKYHGFYRIYQSGDSLLWIKDQFKLSCVDVRTEQYVRNISAQFVKRGITTPVEDLFVDDQQRIWLHSGENLIQYKTLEILKLNPNQGLLQDVASFKKNLFLFYNNGEVACYNIQTKKELYRTSAYSAIEHGLYKNTSMVVKGEKGFYQLRNGSKGGFFFFDPVNKSWDKILETNYTLNTLIITPEGIAYISCPHGFWVINTTNGQKRYLPKLKTIEGKTIDTEVSTLFYDKQGGMWLGTLNQGLLYSHPSRYKFNYIGRSYFTDEASSDIIVKAFAEDNDEKIYVKSLSGLYRYQPFTGNGKVLTPISSASIPKEVVADLQLKPTQIFNNQVYNALITDSRNWTWAGSSDGLTLYNPETQDTNIFYSEDGLCNNFVHALLEDRNHDIWVTTSYGISQIKVDSISKAFHFVNYTTSDGTLEAEYTEGAAFEAKDGTLYFGGINGFNTFKPDKKSTTSFKFNPVFTTLFLRGEKVQTGELYDGRILLENAAPFTTQIELSYDQNFLTFEYSAINYQNPHQTIFRYQLKGIDSHWHEGIANKQRGAAGNNGIIRASYTNLPPGHYTFNVLATTDKNLWNGGKSTLYITINAPWWKTKLAYILYILTAILVISASIITYNRYSRKKLELSHKEEMLFLRIRSLIEQVSQLESEKESYITNPQLASIEVGEIKFAEEVNIEENADSIFLAKAITQVEKNLNTSNYSVEQLSRDLCMDRTGLYRKLIALLDKSPSLFIRHIRLQKAAQLITEGCLSITEITDKVGFNSSSYFSKCFQETYGCRPSEYADKNQKST